LLPTLAMFFKGAAIMSLLFLFFGLIKPWWLLWWEDTQNRLKVIKLYGGIAAVSYLLSKAITLFF
jgi:hypothetical protein